jgi:hypothetical protein
VEWPDRWFGLAEKGDVCADLITPGEEVNLHAHEEARALRADADDDKIRMER